MKIDSDIEDEWNNAVGCVLKHPFDKVKREACKSDKLEEETIIEENTAGKNPTWNSTPIEVLPEVTVQTTLPPETVVKEKVVAEKKDNTIIYIGVAVGVLILSNILIKKYI